MSSEAAHEEDSATEFTHKAVVTNQLFPEEITGEHVELLLWQRLSSLLTIISLACQTKDLIYCGKATRSFHCDVVCCSHCGVLYCTVFTEKENIS